MFKSLIIADDFTGANDTGMQLCRRGYQTRVVFRSPEKGMDSISYVIDTESRGLEEAEAYQKVKRDVQEVDFSEYRYVIKKVDSTLRGNVGHEIKAVDDVHQSELVVFMPALPDLNRVTIDAVHMLNGIPITQTEIAKDPKKPVMQDNIKRMLESVYDELVVHISIKDIEAGKISFAKGRIYAVDAKTNQQMQAVIRAANDTGKRILFAGTAAIADNILAIENPVVPSLGLIASISEVTNEQVKYAEECGTKIIQVMIPELIKKETSIHKYIEDALKMLEQKEDVLIISSASYQRKELERTRKAAAESGISGEEASCFTQDIMGKIGKSILEKVPVSGVFLTGGDTAIGFFEMVESKGSEIIGEVAMGIPVMQLTGGKFGGLKVITKAGAFGNKDAISYGLRKLKERQV